MMHEVEDQTLANLVNLLYQSIAEMDQTEVAIFVFRVHHQLEVQKPFLHRNTINLTTLQHHHATTPGTV